MFSLKARKLLHLLLSPRASTTVNPEWRRFGTDANRAIRRPSHSIVGIGGFGQTAVPTLLTGRAAPNGLIERVTRLHGRSRHPRGRASASATDLRRRSTADHPRPAHYAFPFKPENEHVHRKTIGK